MILRSASFSDLPAAASLYRACFGEDGDYPDRFLSRCLSDVESDLLLALEGDTLVGMACAVGVTLHGSLSGAYLYAVCTAEAHRGKGICRALLDFARARYPFVCLIPASPSLTEFYRARGFTIRLRHQATPSPDLLPSPRFRDLILESHRDAAEETHAAPLLSTPHRQLSEETVCAPLPI